MAGTATVLTQSTSWWSTFITSIIVRLFARGRKGMLSTGAFPHDATQAIPKSLSDKFGVEVTRYDFGSHPPSIATHLTEWTPLHLRRSRIPTSETKRTVFYLHGGAYQNALTPVHWNFVARLANDLNADIVVQTYTMIPYGGVHDVIPNLVEVFRAVHAQAKTHGHEVIVAGDSAGGGLSVALTLALHQATAPLPDQLVLIAPWLDLTASHPDIERYAKLDPWLKLETAHRLGPYWATGPLPMDQFLLESNSPPKARTDAHLEAMQHPLASPLFAPDFAFLAKAGTRVTLITGTHDMLYLDSETFVDRLKKAGVEFTFIRGPRCVHVYPILVGAPLPSLLFRESEGGLRLLLDSVRRYTRT
ncbi:Alpha/Beta hydrolase protein [Fimicolochytrium jonesii]|uniref:Alpha/Beta hydrolase protein n=1 Tax=Fimicolochytrium jonesii TaxID=1396493 RepID=UPI0022FE706F|nr:Alpha/Beta hydrolase protein [Fimicolochytrium jonesii]KAI8820426.1 Alpha/Beta hydrolase protein [Fimicolochytrium jonesii]